MIRNTAESFRKHHPENAITMNKILADFLTSNAGLITRHVVATATPLLAGWAAIAVANGVPGEVMESLSKAALAALAWGVSIALSRLAHKANQDLTPPNLKIGDALKTSRLTP